MREQKNASVWRKYIDAPKGTRLVLTASECNSFRSYMSSTQRKIRAIFDKEEHVYRVEVL